MKVSFQGWPGSNSDVLAREAFPGSEKLPCITFQEALAAVQTGAVDLGLIPIDNSIAGRVADVHHLLPGSGLHIIGEHFLRVHHQLVALPGAKTDHIREIHSHVHALGQCRQWLQRHPARAVVHADTAGAASMVAERGDPTLAAISTRLAAELYGLEILQPDIEDADHNTTRFVVLSRDEHWAPANAAPSVTSFVFRVRSLPAALYKALGGFATNGVNITKLESYMVGGDFALSDFYVEAEGHPKHEALANALEELQFFTSDVRILGVFPASPFRVQAR